MEKIHGNVTLCDDCHTKAHDDNEDIARQVHKEIIPLSHDDHEKVHEFNKFYLNFYENDRDIKRSDSHYCIRKIHYFSCGSKKNGLNASTASTIRRRS